MRREPRETLHMYFYKTRPVNGSPPTGRHQIETIRSVCAPVGGSVRTTVPIPVPRRSLARPPAAGIGGALVAELPRSSEGAPAKSGRSTGPWRLRVGRSLRSGTDRGFDRHLQVPRPGPRTTLRSGHGDDCWHRL